MAVIVCVKNIPRKKPDPVMGNCKIQPNQLPSKNEVAERPTDMGNKRQITKTTAKTKISKKEQLLNNPEVRRWHDNLARGSPLTAEVRLRRLGKFCEIHSMTPMELADLAMRDLRAATNLLEDHVTMMEEQDHSPGYIADYVKSTKSWLTHFDIRMTRKIKISNPDHTPTIQNERVPDAQEMSEILARAGLRASATISLIAKSGLRPEVLGNHDGTDGLRMRDLPDIAIRQGVARCTRVPCQVLVRASLSKARHQYFTFLTYGGTKVLLGYLNDRLARGESLHGDAPVVAPDSRYKLNRGKNHGKAFLPTKRITSEIRQTFRPRFQWRPYVLRAYFDTELLIAESRGKIAHDFRVFFMGHKGSMESKYTTNKGMLPEIMLHEMRESFRRSEELLDLESSETDPALEQKQDMQNMIEDATPEQLGLMLEVFQKMNIGKTGQASG